MTVSIECIILLVSYQFTIVVGLGKNDICYGYLLFSVVILNYGCSDLASVKWFWVSKGWLVVLSSFEIWVLRFSFFI